MDWVKVLTCLGLFFLHPLQSARPYVPDVEGVLAAKASSTVEQVAIGAAPVVMEPTQMSTSAKLLASRLPKWPDTPQVSDRVCFESHATCGHKLSFGQCVQVCGRLRGGVDELSWK